MSDELRAAIGALQSGDDARAQQAFAEIAEMVRRDASECSGALSSAISNEVSAGGLRTPRLLTLLGLTREPVLECVPLCVDLLRAELNKNSSLPSDAMLGAAAIVARSTPQALVPDLTAVNNAEAQDNERDKAKVLSLLLAISSGFLSELPDNGVTDMARWLWLDCATSDLMTVVDFVGWHVQESGADDSLVSLIVDLVERVPASAKEKNYAGNCLKDAGATDAVIEQLQNAWRAICVAPALNHSEPTAIADPEPPAPDARADQFLAVLSEGDEQSVELAQISIEQILEQTPSHALSWWLAVTVDALPPWRRCRDIDWALVQIVTALRRHGEAMIAVPPSVLQRWLDTPQLLNSISTKIALDLLSRQQPEVVVRRYLHRAVAASSEGHAEILMGGLWRALAASEPEVLLAVASRWVSFDFGKNSLLELLIDLLIERTRQDRALIDTLAGSVMSIPDMSDDAIVVARDLLNELRNQSEENRHA